MIGSYNRNQVIKAICLAVAGVACYGLAWLFFRYGLSVAFHGFGIGAAGIPWLALAILGLITWSGWRHWQNGGGFKSYVESSLFHDLGEDSAHAFVADHYAHRITGPAYVLGQIFLGGPLLLLRSRKHWVQRLPSAPDLEPRLNHALQVLRSAGKWQSIDEHPDLRLEILMLAQMKKIDFSAYKGPPRIKAFSADSHGI